VTKESPINIFLEAQSPVQQKIEKKNEKKSDRKLKKNKQPTSNIKFRAKYNQNFLSQAIQSTL